MRIRKIVLKRLGGVIALGVIASTFAVDAELNWWTTDGGGDLRTAGGPFTLSGTIGQPEAGVMRGGAFALTGGFWFAHPAGDCNADGWIDFGDYESFATCLDGPQTSVTTPVCDCFDLDADSDVDLSDLARLQQAFAGS